MTDTDPASETPEETPTLSPADEANYPRPELGRQVVRDQVKTLPDSPGVYRMLNALGEVLYVGKARSLKKRVSSYAREDGNSRRIQRMVSLTRSMEIVTTKTEAEALLLESNMIKGLKPRYNILLRDDKSFPWILIPNDHDFPALTKHRGAKGKKGQYFGPFASAGAVNQTIPVLHKAFLLRSCTDSAFENRERPCLEYQIKRCSAPCVGLIDKEAYGKLVEDAADFLHGKSSKIQQDLAEKMEEAAEALDFEQAAVLRDRIKALSAVQSRQDINMASLDEADVIAAWQDAGSTCIQVFFYRSGRNYGNRAYFPRHDREEAVEDVLAAFIGQFYEDKQPAKSLVISHKVEDQDLLAEALSIRAEYKVQLHLPQRGEKKVILDHALDNARAAHGRQLAETQSQKKLLEGVQALFAMNKMPERIEVYDNSHQQGSHAVGGMIVAGPEGFVKNAYRKFTIRDPETEPGDDYAMMREVLTRRLSRLVKEETDGEKPTWPDLLLIDGGKGQLGVAVEVAKEVGVFDRITIVGVAKGPDRDAGREDFFMPGRAAFKLPPKDPVLYYLQRLRDEAHRFAIGAHRQKRSIALGRSALDEIPGIGPKRKKALLHYFGSVKAISRAGVSDLETVEGINQKTAELIYNHFHNNQG